MKNLTLGLMMMAAAAFTASNSFAQDLDLGINAESALRGPGGGGGGPGRGGPGGPGRGGPGRGDPGRGGPGHGGPGHGGPGGPGHGGPGGPGHGGPGHGGPGHGGPGHGGPGHGGPGHGGPGHGGPGFPGFPGNPGYQPRPFIVTCGNGGDQRCYVNARIYRAELARQRSGNACIYGRTWGYDSNSVWVSRGCRGDFAVYLN